MTVLRIELLGGVTVARNGRVLDDRLARKPKALLAYLALLNGASQSREKLAEMFWSNHGEVQARANLRQTLSILRQALRQSNDGPLLTEGDSVALCADDLEIDVVEFEQLVAEATPDALKRSAELYKGDLLDGFSLKEESFEGWTNAERARLRNLAVQALIGLISHYKEQRDQTGILRATTQLLTIDPLSELAHRATMQAYAAQGRQTDALKQYEICRNLLAAELAVEPEPKTLRLYEELKRQRSSRLSGSVRTAGPAQETAVEDKLRRHDGPVVVVLPFANLNEEPGGQYLASGVAENIIAGLTRFRSFVVIAFESAKVAHQATVNLEEAAKSLGATHVVNGSITRLENRVRIAVQLVSAPAGRNFWAETYERKLNDLFAFQDEVAGVIVATLAGRIEEAERVRFIGHAQNAVAYDHVLQGRFHLNRHSVDGLEQARESFEQALAHDPRSSEAYAGLALSYIDEYDFTWSKSANLATLDQAYEFARQAVALDPDDSRARYALARVYVARSQHGLANAQIEKAIELNPNDYLILCTKGWFLTFTGDITEGVACMKDAIRRNPYAPENCLFSMAVAEYMEGRFQAAIDTLGPVATAHPAFSAFLAACFARLGMDEQAQITADEALRLIDESRKQQLGNNRDRWQMFWSKWFPCSDPRDFQQIAVGLRKAGLPA
jgi:DNA-binding SARP family transcriptional activator/Flp pilus assembly protein TadD